MIMPSKIFVTANMRTMPLTELKYTLIIVFKFTFIRTKATKMLVVCDDRRMHRILYFSYCQQIPLYLKTNNTVHSHFLLLLYLSIQIYKKRSLTVGLT